MEETTFSPNGSVEPPAPVKTNKLPKKKKKEAKAEKLPQAPKAVAAEANGDGQGENGSHRATLHKHLRKTRFCMYHLQGACQFGSECSFAHALAEMHQTPDLRKTQLCKAYFEGACHFDNCMFAHGDDELRSTDMFYKKTLCIWYEKGKCRNAEKCRFAHGIKELRARQLATGDVESAAVPGRNGEGKGGKGANQKHSKEKDLYSAAGYGAGGSADPMQVKPGDYILTAAGRPPPQPVQQPPVRLPGGGDNDSASGHNLNAELAQLCQSIAILTAQCTNIQKRMQLEAEFKSIQQQAAGIGMTPQSLDMLASGLAYRGYQGGRPLASAQVPYPPGLSSLSALNGGDLGVSQEMSESMAAALEAMNAGYVPDGSYY